jgi:hypothetical protein
MNVASTLLIKSKESRWWRFKYAMYGKERGLSFGVHGSDWQDPAPAPY